MFYLFVKIELKYASEIEVVFVDIITIESHLLQI